MVGMGKGVRRDYNFSIRQELSIGGPLWGRHVCVCVRVCIRAVCVARARVCTGCTQVCVRRTCGPDLYCTPSSYFELSGRAAILAQGGRRGESAKSLLSLVRVQQYSVARRCLALGAALGGQALGAPRAPQRPTSTVYCPLVEWQ